MDVDPNEKLALTPPAPTAQSMPNLAASNHLMPPAPATQSTPEPLTLDHPTVVDTATLQAGGTIVALYGIEGLKGVMAEGLQRFLAAHGAHVTCQSLDQSQPSSDFVCLQPDGTDVAEVALVNGAARAKTDAPKVYLDQEAAAQSARRGIWGAVKHSPVPNPHRDAFVHPGPSAVGFHPGGFPAARLDAEVAAWTAVANSTTAAPFEAYLRQFPNGVFAGIAAAKIEDLNRHAGPNPRSTSSSHH
jgi:hypothetical protein